MNLETKLETAPSSLQRHLARVFIVAYKEDTQPLETAMAEAGLPCEVLRQEHQDDYKTYSPSYLALLNHRRAWERAVAEDRPVLIVEADFVPVVNFGQLPLPFDPQQTNVGVAWLYTCAPQVYSVSDQGYAQGFSTSMVAYIVNPTSARHLIAHAETIRQQFGPTAYSTWDSEVDTIMLRQKLKNYIPFRNYGEHGGRPNPEHSRNGLSRVHRADVLQGKLAFTPPYACTTNSRLVWLQARLQARLKGVARLLSGKFVRRKVLRESSTPGRILSFAIRRHLTWPL